MHIVDRRLNPSGKNLANRQRFMRRAKAQIRKAVHESAGSRSIKDADEGGEVVLPAQGVHEPSFRRSGSGGIRDHLLPGNKEYIAGDTIQRPPQGGGGGSEGSPDGDGEDDFRFALSREEFVDLFLEDLELPDLAKRRVVNADALVYHRAGYSVSGSPSNLALNRTVRNSLSRRIALRRPKPEELQALRDEIEALEPADEDKRVALQEELARKQRRTGMIPYIDPLDVRYRRFEAHPKPVAQAVMFCLMDVSGSMTEHMKDLAKRFYVLLYIFLKRRYKNVEVVFIRHTHQASEVDEETFFNSPETGGTVVSTALDEMKRVIDERYSPDNWNIYAAQASDGDNTASDNDKTAALLTKVLLPACQYYAYLEVGRDSEHFPPGFIRRDSDLWQTYSTLIKAGAPMAMRKVGHRRDIYPVFRELFAKKTGVEAAAE
jgi:uncharacterized sporulation protein YeaH/YhbH (DUF444 family)